MYCILVYSLKLPTLPRERDRHLITGREGKGREGRDGKGRGGEGKGWRGREGRGVYIDSSWGRKLIGMECNIGIALCEGHYCLECCLECSSESNLA